MTAGENARLTCQVPRMNDFFMEPPELRFEFIKQVTTGRVWSELRPIAVLDRPPGPLRRRRHLDVADAEVRERVDQRIGARRHGTDAAGFAGALHPERIGLGR